MLAEEIKLWFPKLKIKLPEPKNQKTAQDCIYIWFPHGKVKTHSMEFLKSSLLDIFQNNKNWCSIFSCQYFKIAVSLINAHNNFWINICQSNQQIFLYNAKFLWEHVPCAVEWFNLFKQLTAKEFNCKLLTYFFKYFFSLNLYKK